MAYSAEQEVLIRHSVDLQPAYESNLTSLCTELLDAEFITPNQYDKIRTPHRSVIDRKTKSDYCDILAKLEGEEPQLREDGDPQPTPGAVPEQERRKQQAILESKDGDAQLEKGDYQLAPKSYSKAIELDPSSTVFSLRRAKALFQQQSYSETEECCSMFLALDENNGEVYLLLRLGKLKLPMQDFQSTLKLEPGNMEANMYSARLESELTRRAKCAKEEGPPKQSLSSLGGISHQPTPELEVDQTLDAWEEQERRKQQAIQESKDGDAQLEKGNYQLIAKSYSKAMELDPSSAIFLVSRAKALFQQQLYLETEECCSMFLALDENNGKANMYLLRAKARAKLGKLKLAIQDFQSTLKLEPGNMEANTRSAILEAELRRRAKHAKEEGPPKQSPSSLGGISHQPTPELEVAQTLDAWEISLRTLLGEKVLKTNNLSTEISVNIFEAKGTVVGLFFSAIWCPPSREFTPKLVGWYKRFKNGPNGHLLDIVFISSDIDDSEFREYCRHMPGFYALDFKDRNKEAKLASRFKVDAIPTLIFVDGKTGKLISKEGRSIVREDPNGEQFPWKPKPFLDIIPGAKLIDQDEKEIEWEQLQGKIIALFFSAHWCPGQRLTPTLVATYHMLKKKRQDFEFIYISSDETEEEWKTSLASMPWPSFHYGDKRPETIRNDSFRINSIPALILLDENGGTITTDGLMYMFNDPDGETFPWYVNCLTEDTVEYINDTAYLIWFVPTDSASTAKNMLEPVAKEYISKKARENMEVKLMFFVTGEKNETSASIREKARLPRGDPLLAIIDVPGNQVHVADHSELSEVNAKKFVYDYLTRKLTGRRLR